MNVSVIIVGPTLIDVFNTEAYLQSGVSVKCTYNRSEPAFYMLQGDANRTESYRFEISKIGLYVPIVKVTESLLPYLGELTDSAPARYPFSSVDCKQYNISGQSSLFQIGKLYEGRIPHRLVLAFYRQTSVAGSTSSSGLFTSSDISLRSIKLGHNGLTWKEVLPQFDDGLYTTIYRDLVQFARSDSLQFMITHDGMSKGHR